MGAYQGVANLGYKPTVSEGRAPSLEVHLLDFDQDIYGEHMRVGFLRKLRDEQKFAGLEQLQQQIRQDIARARSGFARSGVAANGGIGGQGG
jgi:riboflavin kinase/FMN adenylyltransferase